ncbi:MAG: methylglyoxal synthase [Crocinitomicaceae bacterium]
MEIALIAHNAKKEELIDLIIANLSFFLSNGVQIYSTNNTGRKIQELGIEVVRYNSGPLGGDAQIASMVVGGDCDMVIFLRDPLDKHPHDPDIAMLLRLCDVHNVPIATNSSSANLLLNGLSLQLESLQKKESQLRDSNQLNYPN